MTERDKFEAWFYKDWSTQAALDNKTHIESAFVGWQACAAQYEAQLKVAEDALKYYAKQTNAGYGFVALEALSKMRGMQ